MTVSELASHSHFVRKWTAGSATGDYIPGSTQQPSDTVAVTNLPSTTDTGDNTPFNVMDPYIVLNYIIKY